MLSKTDFRKNIKSLRDTLGKDLITEISQNITNNILQWEEYTWAKNVMIFYPLANEISLLKLMEDSSKTFYFPVVDGDKIFPVAYDKKTGFKKGAFGIYEPAGLNLKNLSLLDIVFAPALAADKRGFRLGYGKGFYDRFFEHLVPKTIKVVPVYSKFLYDAIPADKYDKCCDFLITERYVLKTKSQLSLNN